MKNIHSSFRSFLAAIQRRLSEERTQIFQNFFLLGFLILIRKPKNYFQKVFKQLFLTSSEDPIIFYSSSSDFGQSFQNFYQQRALYQPERAVSVRVNDLQRMILQTQIVCNSKELFILHAGVYHTLGQKTEVWTCRINLKPLRIGVGDFYLSFP